VPRSTTQLGAAPVDAVDAAVSARTTATGWGPVLAVLVLLLVSNVVANRLLPDAAYVPWNAGMAGLLLVVSLRVDGRRRAELGLDRATLGRGLRVGGVIVAATALVYLVGVALPWTHDLFDDRRVDGMDLPAALYAALVRVPLGTVLLEEVAFRGVLPAILTVRLGTLRAVLWSAGLFGVWHVLPSLGLHQRNPIVEQHMGSAGVPVLVALAVAATAVSGLFLWGLRRWSGSLAAPALAHWSTNGLGYLLAYLVTR
jgi:CAAX protease family protein